MEMERVEIPDRVFQQSDRDEVLVVVSHAKSDFAEVCRETEERRSFAGDHRSNGTQVNTSQRANGHESAIVACVVQSVGLAGQFD